MRDITLGTQASAFFAEEQASRLTFQRSIKILAIGFVRQEQNWPQQRQINAPLAKVGAMEAVPKFPNAANISDRQSKY